MQTRRLKREYADAYPAGWTLDGDKTPRPQANTNLWASVRDDTEKSQTIEDSYSTQKTLKWNFALNTAPSREYPSSYPVEWTVPSPSASTHVAPIPKPVNIGESSTRQDSPPASKPESNLSLTRTTAASKPAKENTSPSQSPLGRGVQHASRWSDWQWYDQYGDFYCKSLDAQERPAADEFGLAVAHWKSGDGRTGSWQNLTTQQTFNNKLPPYPPSPAGYKSTFSPHVSGHSYSAYASAYPPSLAGYKSTVSPHVSGHTYSANAPQYQAGFRTHTVTVSPCGSASAGSSNSAQAYQIAPHSYRHSNHSPWSVSKVSDSTAHSLPLAPAGYVNAGPSPFMSLQLDPVNYGLYSLPPAGCGPQTPPTSQVSVRVPHAIAGPPELAILSMPGDGAGHILSQPPKTLQSDAATQDIWYPVDQSTVRRKPQLSSIRPPSPGSVKLTNRWRTTPPAPIEGADPWSGEVQWMDLS